MEGRDLIGYAVNSMGGDKLTNLMTIFEELSENNIDEVTRRAISLINPYNQYGFLEDSILAIKDYKNKIIELLKSYKIEIPVKYGWRHTSYCNGEKKEDENYDFFDDKYACYRDMHKDAMQTIVNAMDCLKDIPITILQNDIYKISIDAGVFTDIYELYEM